MIHSLKKFDSPYLRIDNFPEKNREKEAMRIKTGAATPIDNDFSQLLPKQFTHTN
ncbi:hypothetical protein J6TS1_30760 [Siminovitchia terrae]|uniref:Uncharacterized protein n=1 Tax=Siminovitchia terrae TaxID=1914933 RepID=A0ABQ4KZ29_SIMTE|nr:hypothetical protein J22TS1_34540 [Siminovitchia terrae]GIN97206.1 hypothetical protein J6TS1_30760 [Siminovitchia terrae]